MTQRDFPIGDTTAIVKAMPEAPPTVVVEPTTGETFKMNATTTLALFEPAALEEAIFTWPPERVAALLRSYMDWETEVGRHLKRVMSDALYANLLDKGSKMTVTVEVDGQTIQIKGEKRGTAEHAETWDCQAVYDECVELVKEEKLLPEVLDEFDLVEKVEVKCTATLVSNLRDRGGEVGERISALVTQAPRARKPVTVAWK